jgi:hypothetical protein
MRVVTMTEAPMGSAGLTVLAEGAQQLEVAGQAVLARVDVGPVSGGHAGLRRSSWSDDDQLRVIVAQWVAVML